MVGVHPQTLRLYERVGLVKPCRANNVGHGNRLYSEADINRLRQIQRFTQEMGVNLAGVEVILSLLDQMEQLRAESEARMRRFQQEMEAFRKRLG
jgi:MerR family transcriptional regulator, heat shock protein HspR